MKVTELRVGNLVKSNNPIYRHEWLGKTLAILEIKDESVSVIAVDELPCAFVGGQFLKYIEPIELTPEILIKVGFTERSNSQGTYYHIKHKEFGGYAYDLEKKYISTYYPAACNGFCSLDIEYLHQLQNLYFALTGEELTLKQKP